MDRNLDRAYPDRTINLGRQIEICWFSMAKFIILLLDMRHRETVFSSLTDALQVPFQELQKMSIVSSILIFWQFARAPWKELVLLGDVVRFTLIKTSLPWEILLFLHFNTLVPPVNKSCRSQVWHFATANFPDHLVLPLEKCHVHAFWHFSRFSCEF